MTGSELEAAGAAVAIVATLYGLSAPVRRWWQQHIVEHRLDHRGRPARIDEGTAMPYHVVTGDISGGNVTLRMQATLDVTSPSRTVSFPRLTVKNLSTF